MIVAAVLAAAAACGSYGRATAVVSEQVALFTVGKALAQLRTEAGDPAMKEEYWGEPPRHDLPWLLEGKDGNAVVGHVLYCDFDARDALVACKSGDLDTKVRVVDEDAFAAIQKGQSAVSVLARLCEPERTQQKARDQSVLHYTVKQAPGGPWGTCFGEVTIKKGFVTRVETICR